MEHLYHGKKDAASGDEGSADEKLDGPAEGSEEAILTGILEGTVKSDSPGGQKFSRDFRKAHGEEMKGLPQMKIKEMKKKYGMGKVKALKSERLREDNFEEMDWSKATYEPFDEIVRLEGGAQNVKNYEAAVNYCK